MVNIYVPLMKELHIDWKDIKNTPRVELEALVIGLSNYNILHAYDGYSSEDVNEMAKKKPSIRSEYAKTQQLKAKFGNKKDKVTSFSELIGK